MKINTHEVQMGRRSDAPEDGGGAPRGKRIDTGRVQMGMDSEEPQAEPGLRQRVGRLFDNPQKRARQAAEIAHLQATRARDEVLRQRDLAEARNALRQVAKGKSSAMQTPNMDGIAATLAYIAASDPGRAQKLAQVIGRQVLEHNIMVASSIEQRAVRERQAAAARLRFSEAPITSDVNLTQASWLRPNDNDGFMKRATKGSVRAAATVTSFAVNAVSRPVLTMINSIGLREEEKASRRKEPPHFLDAIRLDGTGVHVSAPMHPNVPEVNITPASQEKLHTNPPPWMDSFVGVAAMVPGLTRQKILDLLPIGEIVVTHPTIGTIARVPAWYPSHLEKRIKVGMTQIASSTTTPIPEFKPIPNDYDLLKNAAEALGPDMDEIPEIPDVLPPLPRATGFGPRIMEFFGRK